MPRLTGRATKQAKSAAKRVFEKAESSVMASVGRKAVRAKVKEAGVVGKKAAKAALISGAIAAASVVVKEIRKRKKLREG